MSINSMQRVMQVDIGSRLVNVYLPIDNGSYVPRVNDLIELRENGRNLVYTHNLLKGESVQSGDYVLNCHNLNIMRDGERMFSMFGAGYSDWTK